MGSRTAAAPRPLLRGYLHLAGAIVAPFAFALLLIIADSPRTYIGGGIFGASLILVYSTSASYHLWPWSPGLMGLARRVDHSMIFVFIAGTYTPFALMILGTAGAALMLSAVWGLAAVGALLAIAPRDAPRWAGVGVYLAVGWIGLLAVNELVQALPPQALALIVTGGLLYSLGAVIYAARWPDPSPRFFGYHELFHALVLGASVVLYAVVAVYVMPL